MTLVEIAIAVCVLAVLVALIFPEVNRRRVAAATRELPEAVAAGDFPRVADLLARGADVDAVRQKIPGGTDRAAAMSHSMLSLAIRLRHPDVARLLLRHGADPNGDVPGNTATPLFWAAYIADEKLFDALVDAGADIEFVIDKSTAWQRADGKYNNVANFLGEKGARTEFPDP